MRWLFSSDDYWLISTDEKWLRSPDANNCMNLFVEFIFLIIVLPFELDLYNKLDFLHYN